MDPDVAVAHASAWRAALTSGLSSQAQEVLASLLVLLEPIALSGLDVEAPAFRFSPEVQQDLDEAV